LLIIGKHYLPAFAVRPNDMTICYRCGWEGEENEMTERPGNLLFYDNLLKEKTTAEITRLEYLCPKCGEVVCSKRFVDGILFNR
jgi:predicted RNA-binding Zn-ribbon protein involved in translation (DUF1610 family)